jgi:hypothetical protein
MGLAAPSPSKLVVWMNIEGQSRSPGIIVAYLLLHLVPTLALPVFAYNIGQRGKGEKY